MKTQVIKISKLKNNPSNPRLIKDEKYNALVKSIKEFPTMLDIRPIVIDSEYFVLGGNMRLKACIEAGLTEIPVIIADQLTEEQKKEFIIKDNLGYGEWDWDMIADEWDYEKLTDWGMDIQGFGMNSDFIDSDEYNYMNKVTIQFKDFETATAYYENALKENLKATLS